MASVIDWARSIVSGGRQKTGQSIIQMVVLYMTTRGRISGSDRDACYQASLRSWGVGDNERTDDEEKVTKMNRKS